ncbi:MAG: hypothetical protein KF871_02005 [Hydrogenophaga sp.]|uniref:hypothetical protein n=1 Tax=Hydrogenophaga sp. TaxID=1904254 RepID=UPI001D87BDF3|nr:hypothetical protein [Hydrogenophaga sp.]MBX3608643.1 hypothetical protein [Hydrogenophaga sp.]
MMKRARKTKATPASQANERMLAEVNAIVDDFIKENPRLEFTDSSDIDDSKEGEREEQELADIYRKHLGLLGSN